MYSDFDNMRASVIAAAMVRQMIDYREALGVPPNPGLCDLFLEEAAAIADEVEAAMHRANVEERRN